MGLIAHGIYINGFLKNNLFWDRSAIYDPEWHILLCILMRCKDCFTILHNKKSQERNENYINVFSERNRTPSNFVILTQKWYGLFVTFDLLSDLILDNKRDQEVHENFISCFLRENLIWGNLIFLDHFLMFYLML